MLTTASALAQDPVPSLDLRGFNPPSDPGSGLYFEPAASPATWDFNAAWWNAYSWRPVTLKGPALEDPARDEVRFKVIEHQLTGDVVANIGLFERLAIGVDIPYVAFETGDDPAPEATEVLGTFDVPTAALGDIKLLVKGTLVPPTTAEFGGFALALHERLGFPSGNESSYLGEGHVQSETRLLVEYRYLAVALHGAIGVKVRADKEQFGCAPQIAAAATTMSEVDCPTTFGHEMPWGLSLVFRPQAIGLDDGGHMTWFAESFGYVPISPEKPFTNAAVSQAQIGGGARLSFVHDLSIVAAVDAALVGGIGTPPVRGTLALAWAPRKHDEDGDGVRDEQDRCPDLVEDPDGFDDNDGCPDWDNDDDGVPDESDRCAREKEDRDGYLDDDGCLDADNDGDRILDGDDHCPMKAGIESDDPEQRGCPDLDPDKDRVKGAADGCPNEAEDVDGHQDTDGCPDLDNDGDGLEDKADACRDVAGVRYPASPADDGCPDKDADGITDGKDKCPEEAGGASDDPEKHGCKAPEPTPRGPGRGGAPKAPGGAGAPPKAPGAPGAPPKAPGGAPPKAPGGPVAPPKAPGKGDGHGSGRGGGDGGGKGGGHGSGKGDGSGQGKGKPPR